MEFSESMKNNFDFHRAYSRGKNAATPLLAMYCRPNRRRVNRVGITVSAKLGGAVTRNKVRRRLREAYRLNEGRFVAGYDIVAVARGRGVRAPYGALEKDLLSLASRLGALK